jgi:hypothetical protein
MATTTTLRRWGGFLASALLVPALPAALIAACTSDNANPQPGPPSYTIGGDAGDAGGQTGHPDDSGTTVTPPDDSSTGADAPLTQKDGAPVGDAASCETDGGCWSCTPASPAEFLNQCTSSQCSPFPNATRLPNYDGGLPPLN